MRSGWLLAVAIVAGLVVLLGVVALIGGDDDSGETVPQEWADNVCGTVVWRGEMESIVDGVRSPRSARPAASRVQSRRR